MAGPNLSTRRYRGRVVVAIHGELDIADAASVAATLAALAASEGQIIIDLADLDFIDCRGLAALVSARNQARQGGGDVLLAAARPQMRRILAATALTHVFSVHASVADAAGPAVSAGRQDRGAGAVAWQAGGVVCPSTPRPNE